MSCSSCGGCGGSYPGGVFARQGAQGIPGPPGPAGPPGPTVTATSGFAANTSGALINVIVGGTNIPLPNGQSLPTTITVDGTNTIFTVQETGRYYISYQINKTVGLVLSSRLLINGVPLPQSVVSPAVSVNKYSAEVITSLNAGNTISLQLFGVLAAVTLASGVGASLTIIRVE